MKRFLLVFATALLASGAFAQNAATEQFAGIITDASQQSWLQIAPDAAATFIFEVEPFLLDVRRQDEYDLGRIEGAVLIPITELGGRLGELPTDLNTPMIVYCGVGVRGQYGLTMLKLAGYTNVKNLSGGFNAWKAAGFPIEE